MVRRLLKTFIKRGSSETVGQYFKRIDRVQNSINEFCYGTVFGILVIGLFLGALLQPVEGYVKNPNGVPINGEYSHWCDDNCEICK